MKKLNRIFVTAVLFFVFSSAILAQSQIGNWHSATPFPKTDYWWHEDGWYLPIICDNVEIDYLEGTVSIHGVWIPLFEDGFISSYKGNFVVKGEAVSTYTGEIFKIRQVDKGTYITEIATAHVNLKGNRGSNYIGTFTYHLYQGTVISVDITICK